MTTSDNATTDQTEWSELHPYDFAYIATDCNGWWTYATRDGEVYRRKPGDRRIFWVSTVLHWTRFGPYILDCFGDRP